MRKEGAPTWLERERRLAVERLLDGYSPSEVAEFLGVGLSSVYRWWFSFQEQGWGGLVARPVPGRPPKLTQTQCQEILGWINQTAQEFGFATPRWTAPRLAQVIRSRLGVELHPHYLNAWLKARKITPQVPTPVARERDPEAVARWVANTWPAIKKSPRLGRRLSFHR